MTYYRLFQRTSLGSAAGDQVGGLDEFSQVQLQLLLTGERPKPDFERDNKSMRRIAVYRDGNQMAAQIGPDWVEGIAGFGDTVADALRDLAYSFADNRYELRGNSVRIEVAGQFIEVTASPGQSPADVLLTLAGMIEARGYQESDFPEPDWDRLANEERVIPRSTRRN